MTVTREEQATERQLRAAEAAWLRARGWATTEPWTFNRWRHESAPPSSNGVSFRDALELTRAEPLRYRRRP